MRRFKTGRFGKAAVVAALTALVVSGAAMLNPMAKADTTSGEGLGSTPVLAVTSGTHGVDNTVYLGDTVTYSLKANVKNAGAADAYSELSMDALYDPRGLNYKGNSVSVYNGTTKLTAKTDYTVTNENDDLDTSKKRIRVTFSPQFLMDTEMNGQEIRMTYDLTVKSNVADLNGLDGNGTNNYYGLTTSGRVNGLLSGKTAADSFTDEAQPSSIKLCVYKTGLSITKKINTSENANVGDKRTYTITVKNTETNSQAQNIVVKDRLTEKASRNFNLESAGVMISDVTVQANGLEKHIAPTKNGTEITVNTGMNLTFGSGTDTMVLSYTVTFGSKKNLLLPGKSIVNAARVSADNLIDENNKAVWVQATETPTVDINKPSATTSIGVAGDTIDISAGDRTANAGDTISYTATIRTSADSPVLFAPHITNFTVPTEITNGGATFENVKLNNTAINHAVNGNVLTVDAGSDIQKGASTVVTFDLKLGEKTSKGLVGKTITMSAKANGDNFPEETLNAPSVYVAAPKVSTSMIVKNTTNTVDSFADAKPSAGDSYSYTMTVRQQIADSIAYNTGITVSVTGAKNIGSEANVTDFTAKNNGKDFPMTRTADANGNILFKATADLTPSDNITISFKHKIGESTSKEYNGARLVASIAIDTAHSNATSSSQSHSMEVQTPKWTLAKAIDKDVANNGDEMTYTITATQSSSYAVSKNFAITDLLDKNSALNGVTIDTDGVSVADANGKPLSGFDVKGLEVANVKYPDDDESTDDTDKKDDADNSDDAGKSDDDSSDSKDDSDGDTFTVPDDSIVGFTVTPTASLHGVQHIVVTYKMKAGDTDNDRLRGKKVVNTASLKGDNFDSPADSSASFSIANATLSLTKETDKATITGKERIKYTITVKNVEDDKNSIAKGVVVDDAIDQSAKDFGYAIDTSTITATAIRSDGSKADITKKTDIKYNDDSGSFTMKFNDGLQAVQKDKDDSGNDEKHDTTFISTKSGTTTLLVDSTDSIVFNDKNSVLISTPKGTTYDSSDDDVVTIDANGALKAVGAGTATVKATVPSGDEKGTYELKLTVVEKAPETKIVDNAFVITYEGTTEQIADNALKTTITNNVVSHADNATYRTASKDVQFLGADFVAEDMVDGGSFGGGDVDLTQTGIDIAGIAGAAIVATGAAIAVKRRKKSE